jgi:hypothetical protein
MGFHRLEKAKKKIMEPKVDKLNLPYFEKLPEGYRPGKMEDFHLNGRKKIGMEYLIHTFYSGVFEVHKIGEETTALKLKAFFEENRIYIKSAA